MVRHGGEQGPALRPARGGIRSPATQFTTSITVGELLCGARKRRSEALWRDIERLLAGEIQTVDFDEPAARTYADIRVQLEAAGQRLADPDLRIAAICLAHDLRS